MEREQILIQLRSLNQVSKTLIRCKSQEEAIQVALQEVREKLNVQVASIFLFSKDGVLKRFGIDGVDREGNPLPASWLADETYKPDESFSGKAVPPTGLDLLDSTYGEPQYSNNIMRDFPDMKYGKEYQDTLGYLRCGISVPLNGLNRTFGTLEVLNKSDSNGFQNEDLSWLMLISTTVSKIISDFGRRKNLEEYNKITQEIISLGAEHKFNQNEFTKILESIADDLVSDLTPYKVCILRIKNKNNELEIVKISTTNDICGERDNKPVKVVDGIVGQVFKTNTAEYINDIENYKKPYFNKTWIEKNSLKSHACVPLSIEDNVVGNISVYTGYKHEFSDSDKSFLRTISFLTAAIIYIVQYKEELSKERIELENEKREFHNKVYAQGFDTNLKSFLHEYKNELIDISYNLQKLLSDSGKSNREKERIVSEQIEWIDRRIEGIRSEFESESSVPTAIDINDLVRKAAKFFDLASRDIEVVIIPDKTIPIIEVDETKFKQIIHNLIANAIEAIEKAKPKKAKIFIKTFIVTSDSIEYIQISIEDNGSGIPNEIKDEVFKKGFSTRKSEGGTGMGLYVVSEILREHGGRIYYDSTVGKGTTFFVNIPLKWYQS
jgi:nitrogen-specific signal transduction histidine kinase